MRITAKEDSPDFEGELAWLQKPEIVCSGAQITGIYAKNNLSITEDDFKNTTAKVLLFKYIKQLLSVAEWQPYQTHYLLFRSLDFKFTENTPGYDLNDGCKK